MPCLFLNRRLLTSCFATCKPANSRRISATLFPCWWPAVKRETANFVKDVLEQSPKAVVSKCTSLLQPCAKLAGAGESDVREAGQAALVAFAVRSGSMSVLDKVGRDGKVAVGGLGWGMVLLARGKDGT